MWLLQVKVFGSGSGMDTGRVCRKSGTYTSATCGTGSVRIGGAGPGKLEC